MRTDFISISSAAHVQPEIDAGYLTAIAIRNQHWSREITLRARHNAHASTLVERFVKHVRAAAKIKSP
jgi:hypothetical protein